MYKSYNKLVIKFLNKKKLTAWLIRQVMSSDLADKLFTLIKQLIETIKVFMVTWASIIAQTLYSHQRERYEMQKKQIIFGRDQNSSGEGAKVTCSDRLFQTPKKVGRRQ